MDGSIVSDTLAQPAFLDTLALALVSRYAVRKHRKHTVQRSTILATSLLIVGLLLSNWSLISPRYTAVMDFVRGPAPTNLYLELGIHDYRTASPSDVKRAVRSRIAHLHPDKDPASDTATAHFLELRARYDPIVDPHKRPIYHVFGYRLFHTYPHVLTEDLYAYGLVNALLTGLLDALLSYGLGRLLMRVITPPERPLHGTTFLMVYVALLKWSRLTLILYPAESAPALTVRGVLAALLEAVSPGKPLYAQLHDAALLFYPTLALALALLSKPSTGRAVRVKTPRERCS